jgi:2-(1,2-epoxy-1,2-dihydrophenyl)acetyl-CoA isomerase
MGLVRIEWQEDRVATVVLDRPARHNALTPDLLADLLAAVREVEERAASVVVLTGAGHSFSTGGDVAGFIGAADEPATLDDYAARTVGSLHEVILALLALPMPVIARVNGPVTGGSVGLVLAADMVAMADDAFVQPFYSELGFSPDGGWTALLPERVGTAKALEIQFLNRRIGAAEAVRLGLATETAPGEVLDAIVADWLDALATKSAASLQATRGLVWDEARRARVADRLAAEMRRFRKLVATADASSRMKAFVNRRQRPAGD